jgi:hypothetical protein
MPLIANLMQVGFNPQQAKQIGDGNFDSGISTTTGTFTGAVTVLDDPYAAGWDGSTQVPTKNAIYDKIESLPVLASGTYTPTLTNVTNVASSTSYTAQYLRVGSVVTVSGRVDIDPTASGFIRIEMSLPIASNFSAVEDAGGVGSVDAGITGAFAILADTADDRVYMAGVLPSTSNTGCAYTYTYRIR